MLGLKLIHVSKRGPWSELQLRRKETTVYPKKYTHGFVVLCFVVVMQSFIMNSHEVFIHIHQGCFAGTGAIVRLPQCQWSKPDGKWENQSVYNHNKAQQSKNRVHISWDLLYLKVSRRYDTTPLSHQNDVTPSFWHDNDGIIASCDLWINLSDCF